MSKINIYNSDLFGLIQIIATTSIYIELSKPGQKPNGGLKVAFVMVEYQGSLYMLVIRPPQAEAPKARTTKINSEKNFLDKVIIRKLVAKYK